MPDVLAAMGLAAAQHREAEPLLEGASAVPPKYAAQTLTSGFAMTVPAESCCKVGQRGARPPATRAWLPLAAVGLALLIILTCYHLSRAHLPPDLRFPFISMMGHLPPARWVYAGGFSIVTVLWIVSTVLMRRELERFTQDGPDRAARDRELRWAFWASVVAGLGLGVQGVVPLQRDIVALMLDNRVEGAITLQTAVHQIGAAALFVSSLLHQAAVLLLYARSPPLRRALGATAPVSLGVKGGSLGFAAVTISTSLLWHPATGLNHNLAQLTVGAILQWTFVATLLTFFASYSLDLHTLLACPTIPEAIGPKDASRKPQPGAWPPEQPAHDPSVGWSSS